VYHVAVRGNARQAIFRDDADREHFVRVLAESVGSFEAGGMGSALKIQDSGCRTGVGLVGWDHGQTVAGGV
jgi:hypothetical protein